jgi:hypothetical protein
MLGLLDKAIRLVCPINSVSIEIENDLSTVNIDFKDEATQAEKDAAQLVVDSWDINAKDPVQERIKEYGTPAEQLERIIENGLDAEIKKVAEIKARIPK